MKETENKTESAVLLFKESFESSNQVEMTTSIGELGIDSVLSLLNIS